MAQGGCASIKIHRCMKPIYSDGCEKCLPGGVRLAKSQNGSKVRVWWAETKMIDFSDTKGFKEEQGIIQENRWIRQKIFCSDVSHWTKAGKGQNISSNTEVEWMK